MKLDDSCAICTHCIEQPKFKVIWVQTGYGFREPDAYCDGTEFYCTKQFRVVTETDHKNCKSYCARKYECGCCGTFHYGISECPECEANKTTCAYCLNSENEEFDDRDYYICSENRKFKEGEGCFTPIPETIIPPVAFVAPKESSEDDDELPF